VTWRKLRASRTSERDPLAVALRRKAETGAAGAACGTVVAAGDGWSVRDVVCTAGPRDLPFEERQPLPSASLVVAGTFVYRGPRGRSLLSPGAILLVNAERAFECSHRHGEGDRCLSFEFELAVFERLAAAAGARSPELRCDRLPAVRPLAPIAARARAALDRRDAGASDAFEEIALEVGGAVLELAAEPARNASAPSGRDLGRIARVLRDLESRIAERHRLADLAAAAGLSRYHFLRTFKAVTGVTPHQWLLRARLRAAAERLVATGAPVTEIALDVGFDDLSNFIRSFRAEFGASPSRYRAAA